jgi:hypothetical protein
MWTGTTGADAATHVAVIFDYSGKTFRNDLYPLYKAQRPARAEDLRPAVPADAGGDAGLQHFLQGGRGVRGG